MGGISIVVSLSLDYYTIDDVHDSSSWSRKPGNVDQKTGHTYTSSLQLLATLVVQAWEKVPTELIRKALVFSGYTETAKLHEEEASQEIVQFSKKEVLGTTVEKIAGDDGRMVWIEDNNGPNCHRKEGFLEEEMEFAASTTIDPSSSTTTHPCKCGPIATGSFKT